MALKILTGLTVVVLFFIGPAQAQQGCVEHTSALVRLMTNYDEQVAHQGITHDGGLVEITVSETGSWTILITFPAGLTCIVGAGLDWEAVKADTLGRDS